MTNVAVFGGSFDPPTLGHVMVVTHLLLNEPDIDQVLIVPCYQQSGKHLTDHLHRMQMCEMAFCYMNRIIVSDVEYELGGESLTSRTISELKTRHPDWNLRFVIGSDLRDSIKNWEGADIIENLAPPIIVGRAGIPQEGGPTPISPLVSSTMVRLALLEGRYKDAERYLPAPVLSYIRRHWLYSKDE